MLLIYKSLCLSETLTLLSVRRHALLHLGGKFMEVHQLVWDAINLFQKA